MTPVKKIWGRDPEPTQVPDYPACACEDLIRKDAIAEVRAGLEEALKQAVGDVSVDQWRRIAAKAAVRLRGLR